MNQWVKISLYIITVCFFVWGVLFLLSIKEAPQKITYGVSFNTLYAEELHLDWKETYIAILDELGVRQLRLSAHWPMVEPERDALNFSELDFQIAEAEKRGADIILGVGRRLPRWPECHIPTWAGSLTWDEQKVEIREMITEVVNRYKSSEVVTYWQVENEPFLGVFAQEECGVLDKDFLKEEIDLVRELDPTRAILVTDSGNLGLWAGAYTSGDVFGTSVYVYFWNPEIGPFKSILPPAYYRIKDNVMGLLFGRKESLLIELSAEPWLLQPVVDTPIEVQLERMNIEKFEEIITFAQETRFNTQYLWGAEWWYWLKERGDDSFWLRAQELYAQ
ncbi:MAG: cellulase family glycosylhydrolase [Candidatus Paceibacterota bacterium]